MACLNPRHDSFLDAHFRDACEDAERGQVDILTRGSLLLGHLIREHLTTATTATVDIEDHYLRTVSDDKGTLWEDNGAPNTALPLETIRRIHQLLTSMLGHGGGTPYLMTRAGWHVSPPLPQVWEVPLPDTETCQPQATEVPLSGTVRTVTAAGGVLYHVAASAQPGIPSFTIDGLGWGTTENRDRVRAGTVNAGLPWPQNRISVTVTPTGTPASHTSSLDLSIALAVLAASGELAAESVAGAAFVGELGLNGLLRPVHDMPANARTLIQHGQPVLMVPRGNLNELEHPAAALVMHMLGLNEAVSALLNHIHHPLSCRHCRDGEGPHTPCAARRPCAGCTTRALDEGAGR